MIQLCCNFIMYKIIWNIIIYLFIFLFIWLCSIYRFEIARLEGPENLFVVEVKIGAGPIGEIFMNLSQQVNGTGIAILLILPN